MDDDSWRYAPDVMSMIFFIGLEDTYTNEQLYHLKPTPGKKTVSFKRLVDTTLEIDVAKDNVAEASGSILMCAIRGGDKSKANA